MANGQRPKIKIQAPKGPTGRQSRLVFVWLVRVHQIRFAHRRLGNRLTATGRGLAFERPERNWLGATRRFVQRVDDADVPRAFFTRGFGLTILTDAVGEVDQLGRELILFLALLLAALIANRERVGKRLGIFVRGFDVDVAFGADHAK